MLKGVRAIFFGSFPGGQKLVECTLQSHSINEWLDPKHRLQICIFEALCHSQLNFSKIHKFMLARNWLDIILAFTM